MMKPFNIFVAVALTLIAAGFVFFKDGFNRGQARPLVASEVRLDRSHYLDYSESALVKARKEGKPVLFFAATIWCQSCSVLDEEIIKRQAEIPAGVTILKVDYDHDKTMNQKYAVTAQHTLIVLDKQGREVRRWLGGGFTTLLQELEKS